MNKDSIIAKWIAGDITDADFQKEVSQEEYISYLKLRKALHLHEATQQDLSNDLFDKIKDKTINKQPTKHFNLYKFSTAVASVAAIILLFFGVNKYLSPSSFIVETAHNETKSVQLFDNSKVILDATSNLEYTKSQRKVNLSGAAFFSIEKGDSFLVKTEKATITTLEGNFEVKSLLDMFQVVCYEGKITVVLPHKTIELLPKQSLVMYGLKEQKHTIKFNKAEVVQKESRFNGTPLKYVLKDLENHYGINIVKNKVDIHKKFTGSYVHNDLDLSLQMVFKALQIPYKKSDKHTVILQP